MRKSCWQQEQHVINVYMHGDQRPTAAIRCKTQSCCCGLKYCRCGLKCKMYRMYDTAAWHCRCCWHAVLAARAMWVPAQQHCTDSKHLPHRPAPRSRECSLLQRSERIPARPSRNFSFPLTPLLPQRPIYSLSITRADAPPPPLQMPAAPTVPPVRTRLCSNVTRMRAPACAFASCVYNVCMRDMRSRLCGKQDSHTIATR